MAGTLTIKQGATLQWLLQANNDDGSVLDLTGVTITSQVRDGYGQLVADIGIAPNGTPGQLAVLQATDTWPVGTLVCDIKLVQAGVALVSETFSVVVAASITAPPVVP